VLPRLVDSEQALSRLITQDLAAIDELWLIGKSAKWGSNSPDDRSYVRIIID